MERENNAEQFQQWHLALQKLQAAIDILDRWQAPPHIAAHVDLAVHQLQGALKESLWSGQLDQIVTKAEPQ